MSVHGAGAQTLDDLTENSCHCLGVSRQLSKAYSALACALEKRGGEFDRPARVPSGAVYLAQMMAHDMLLSEVDSDLKAPSHNAIARPLMLSTIYGNGPNSAPHLYAPSTKQTGEIDESSLGRRRMRCLFRIPTSEDQIDTDFARGPTCPATAHYLEPLIADRRNDSHAVLAQLVAAWMRFHNSVFKRSEAWDRGDGTSLSGDLTERFRRTQALVRARWLDVIRKDVLDYLLSPTSLNSTSRSTSSMPPVGARIALRALHCLPLDTYRLPKSGDAKGLGSILNSGAHGSALFVLDEIQWKIDWNWFFSEDDTLPGNSTRYKAAISRHLRVPPRDSALNLKDGCHISNADLHFAFLGGPLNAVHSNSENLLPINLQGTEREHTLRAFLEGELEMTAADEVDALAKDPPLVLVLLLEADLGDADGKHLGEYGSSLLAPWLLGALEMADAFIKPSLDKVPPSELALAEGTFKELLETIDEESS